MIKAILFDVDGTLIDSNDLHVEAWHEAFRHFGYRVSGEQIRSQIGKGGDNLIPALLPDLDDRQRKELEDYRSEIFRAHFLDRAKPFPAVCLLLRRLQRQGIRIVLATSSKKEELDHHVKSIGCSAFIDGMTSKSDVEHSKPDPDIFVAAMRKARPASRQETLVVGDSPYDMEAAGKAGLKSIGLLCGGFSADRLTAAGAMSVFRDPEDLLAHADQLFSEQVDA